jgi:hypothetical protein
MREAALKLTSEFREVPEVRRWLDAQVRRPFGDADRPARGTRLTVPGAHA